MNSMANVARVSKDLVFICPFSYIGHKMLLMVGCISVGNNLFAFLIYPDLLCTRAQVVGFSVDQVGLGYLQPVLSWSDLHPGS